MKKLLILFGVITLIVACGSSKETVSKTVEKVAPMDVTEFAATITEAELKEMLYMYASDEFQGRETGEPGHDIAVNYIKDFYTSGNIAPLQSNGDFFQDVKFNQLYTPDVSASVNGEALAYFDDIVSLSASAEETINVNEVMYVGFGFRIDTKDIKTIYHHGKWNGFSTGLTQYPDDDLVVIILEHTSYNALPSLNKKIKTIVFENLDI